jgi:MFS transporter, OFA family, oxalate/formate antiporter
MAPITDDGMVFGVAEPWRVVGALFVVIACMALTLAAFGVFLPVLAEEFGWSRGAISVALSINLVFGGVCAFGMGHVADRRGPRGILAAAIVIGAVGFELMTGISRLWQLYAAYGLLVGIGFSPIYVLSAATVSRWFTRRRGLALAIVLSGFNLGWLVGGPLTAWLIQHWGWRGAYAALGALVGVVGILATLGVRYPSPALASSSATNGKPDARGPAPGGALAAALANDRLWPLLIAWLLMGTVFMTINVHSVPFARDLGLPLEQASFVLSAYGLGAAVGRLVAGAAADRWGATAVMWICVVAQAAALVGLAAGPSRWALIPLLVIFGVGASGGDTAFVKTVPEVFGLGALGGVMGILGLGWRCGAAIGPVIAGYTHDATRSYALPFAGGVAVLGLAMASFLIGTRGARGIPPL